MSIFKKRFGFLWIPRIDTWDAELEMNSVNSELKTSFWIFLTFILDVDEDLYQVIGTKVGTLRFKCSVCSHKSRYKQGIIDHVKQVHRKERPYACTTCERSFFRKTDLRIHIRSVGLLSLLSGGQNSLHFWLKINIMLSKQKLGICTKFLKNKLSENLNYQCQN